MTEQTKAQRLADALDRRVPVFDRAPIVDQAAAELRRLDANEAALLGALKHVTDSLRFHIARGSGVGMDVHRAKEAFSLITRIEAERNEK